MNPPSQAYSARPWTPVAIGALLAGVFLRLYSIDAPLISDELASASIWAQMPYDKIPINYQFPNNHIFHTLLISVLLKTFGPHPAVIRIPVLIAGVASLVLTFLCALRITGNRKGALGALTLTAFAASPIYYSTNARGYALLTVFSLLTMWRLYPVMIAGKGSESNAFEKVSWSLCFGLLVLWSLGTWTVPTFVYFEGALTAWIAGSLFFSRQTNRPACLKILAVLLAAFAVFYAQYFVVIHPEMLKAAISNAAASTPEKFFPQLLDEWTRPWESCAFLFAAFALLGAGAIIAGDRRAGLALMAAVLFPPLAGWFSAILGLTKHVPDPRVFHYSIPFFYMAVSSGVLETLNRVSGFWFDNRSETSGSIPGSTSAIILVLAVSWGVRDFVVRAIPALEKREPYHEIRNFIQALGPRDLALASNKHHVWFYLYGAEGMRQRVENILDEGRLDAIYFMVSLEGSAVDAEWVEKDQKRFLELKDYPSVHSSAGPVKNLFIQENLLQSAKRIGSFEFFRVRPESIRQTSRLAVSMDRRNWVFPKNLADKVQLASPGATLHFRDSFYMLANKTNAVETQPGRTNIFLMRARIPESGWTLFSNARREGEGVSFDPTWRGNALVMDHPYGASIFNRPWQPRIFISREGSNRPTLAVYFSKEGDRGEIRGMASYSISSDKASSALKGEQP